MPKVSHTSRFSITATKLFEFHLDPPNLVRISPPLPRVRVDESPSPISEGSFQRLRLSVGPVAVHWRVALRIVRPPTGDAPGLIEDVQDEGPFRWWRHRHQVSQRGHGCVLRDVIEFRYFSAPFGPVLDRIVVSPGIKFMLVWRHWRTRKLLA